MGKPLENGENHRKTIRKPWDNHRKMVKTIGKP